MRKPSLLLCALQGAERSTADWAARGRRQNNELLRLALCINNVLADVLVPNWHILCANSCLHASSWWSYWGMDPHPYAWKAML